MASHIQKESVFIKKNNSVLFGENAENGYYLINLSNNNVRSWSTDTEVKRKTWRMAPEYEKVNQK